jgi:hypothetical protein
MNTLKMALLNSMKTVRHQVKYCTVYKTDGLQFINRSQVQVSVIQRLEKSML